MFGWFTRRPKVDPVLEMAKLFSETLTQQAIENRKLVEVITSSSENATKAALATTEVLQKHLDLFRVTDPPEPSIVRDEDEYRWEMERRGVVEPLPAVEPAKQLEFINNHLDIEQMTEELGI